jgi:hypothetical protein
MYSRFFNNGSSMIDNLLSNARIMRMVIPSVNKNGAREERARAPGQV